MRIEHWRYSIPLWLRGLLRRRDVERELDDELRDHIERQTAANVVAGMPPDEARRAALVAFGGVDRIKDESRDVRGLAVFDRVAELRYVARSLLHARTFTLASVATIALAVGAGCTVFTVLNTVLLRPLPYAESERLVGLWHTFPAMDMPLVRQSPGTYLTYRSLARSFEYIGAYDDAQVTLTYDDPTLAPERVPASSAAASVFAMLRVHPVIGRNLTDADELPNAPPVAVISDVLCRSRFGAGTGVIGRRMPIDGTETEIVGVLPASFAFPASDTRLWLPFAVPPVTYLGNFNFRAIGRLRPGVTVAAAQAELEQLLRHVGETYPEQRPGVSTTRILEQVKAAVVVHTMREDAVGDFGRVLALVAAIVVLLVAVAFSNVASLALARVEARQRELAVRSTLGASRVRLWWSLAAESAMVSVIGGTIGLGASLAALATLRRAGPTALPDPMLAGGGRVVLPRLGEIHPDWALVLTAVALTAAFCLMSTLIGGWRVASADALRALRDGGRGTAGRSSQRMRAAFVALEVALSLVLLSGSAVLGRSLLRLRAIQPGYDPTSTLTFSTSLPQSSYSSAIDVSRFYRDAVDRIGRIHGVEAAGVVSKLPLTSGQSMRVVWVEDAPPAQGVLPPAIPIVSASGGYFGAMRIPIIAGRVFDDDAVRRGANEVIVTRGVAVRYWSDSSGRRAIGRRLRPALEGPWYTVVGVAADVRDTSVTAPPTTALYFPHDVGRDSTFSVARGVRNMTFAVRTRGPMTGLGAAVEREIRELAPHLPVFDFATMEELVARSSSRMTFALLLLAIGASATLALGVVGLYGVIAYLVGLRSRELGIRIALGLAPERAARMLLIEGERIVAIGAALGLLAFVAFAKLLSSLAFEVSVVDRAAITVAVATVLTVATLATWIPARRAARIDPAVALKVE